MWGEIVRKLDDSDVANKSPQELEAEVFDRVNDPFDTDEFDELEN